MMQQKKLINTILDKISVKSKYRRAFIQTLFATIFTVQGRINFRNLSRYMSYHETSIANHYYQPFDFGSFHEQSVEFVVKKDGELWILGIDCSYISKSGKGTWGGGKFWSGCHSQSRWGLELSVAALIKTNGKEAYGVDIVQTPGDLSGKEGAAEDYTRVDFYIDQIRRVLKRYWWIRYIVADGYYMKEKVLNFMEEQEGKIFISKLRSNADLKFYLDKKKHPNAHKNRKYEAKFNNKAPLEQLELWNEEGKLGKIKVYSQTLYSPNYKKDFKVCLCVHEKLGVALLCCDNLETKGLKIVELYKVRFQIEFIFRDAKQFAGLSHCQARGEQALDFHFNTSIASVNLARIEAQLNGEKQNPSFNNLKRSNYNQVVLNEFIRNLDLDPNLPEIQQAYEKTCKYGLMNV